MLDADTKRRIDAARDILVGKIPDPKSQVEQITIALTYKLMDDMDAVSEELGGLRSHFSGDFAKYRWANLTRPDAAGDEILQLYVEAISRMRENPNLPPLFRSIFNNAFLPYGDPETLRAFLKAIDEFDYAKSEPLGDAFEYLLSSLGSQGDAGQFLTPRHVIDFIVAAIDPKKYERVLDPACGTAGFLISAYRHIQAANRDADGVTTLEPNDKRRLADNFSGYDISPDMVRLSLVNMYLHGLQQPRVHEYDTLTNEDRWNELADVILANPPFMSPKGGIRPHERFTIQSKRSEVLFVDYIADHLTPRGRAGIIVPEGIVFQSQNAHRSLRKKLVDNFLVAVVSLPAGVFKPYSGVKTSILILDRALAWRTDSIAFFKVENDGFELGDQRRPIDENDLPQAQAELTEYLNRLRNRDPLDGFNPSLGLIVKKARIAADGEYFLNGERYRANPSTQSEYAWARLGDVAIGRPQYGSGAKRVPYDGKVRYVRITDITDSGRLKDSEIVSPSTVEPKYFLAEGDLLIARSGSVGRSYLHPKTEGVHQFAGYLIRFRIDPEQALSEYVYLITHSRAWREWIRSNSKTGTLTNINAKQYSSFRFPLPPLEVQREIVGEIAGYQRVIDGARAVVENWRPRVAVDPAWSVAPIGDIAKVIPGQSPPGESYNSDGLGAPFYQGKTEFGETFIGEPVKWTTAPKRFAERHDILMSVRAPVGPVNLAAQRVCIGRGLAAIRPSRDKFHAMYAFYVLRSMESEITGSEGATFASINKRDIENIQAPLPPLETQRAIAAELDAERALVDANRELIRRFDAKIEAAVGRVWGG